MRMDEDVEDWRELLRVCVASESKLALLYTMRKWKNEGILKVPLVHYVELLIPCILHLENRAGEKIITMILRKGLEIWSGPEKEYLKRIKHTFQTEVLGTATAPAHWSLPYEGRKEEHIQIAHVSGRNEIVRVMITQIHVKIAATMPGNTILSGKLLTAVNKYSPAMSLLTQHRELSDEEMEEFQTDTDFFIENWVEIFGAEGVTNYIHILGSAHMLYFLKIIDAYTSTLSKDGKH